MSTQINLSFLLNQESNSISIVSPSITLITVTSIKFEIVLLWSNKNPSGTTKFQDIESISLSQTNKFTSSFVFQSDNQV